MPTRNINLTEHLDHFVERQIASGRYSNASEIVRASLRLLEEQEQERKAKLKSLRQAAKQGFEEIDQGSVVVDQSALNDRVASLLKSYGPPVLVEEFIDGRELNVSMVETPKLRILPVSEVSPRRREGGAAPVPAGAVDL